MNRYVLWDMDGTIVESEEVVFKLGMFRYASAQLGLDFNLNKEQYVGLEGHHIFETLLEANHISDKESYTSRYTIWYEAAVAYIKQNIDLVKPRANVIEIWKKLHAAGVVHAVVTSSIEDVAIAYLNNVGLLKLCKNLTCINHVSSPKPSPIPYSTAMSKLNITTKNCVAVEDSHSGIISATSAGIYTIGWVKNKNDFRSTTANKILEHLDADIILKSFEQLEP